MKELDKTLTFHIPHDMFQPSAFKKLDGSFSVDLLCNNTDTYKILSPIEYEICITNTGDAFLVSGSAKTKALTECSRCLESVHVCLETEIDAYYLIEAPVDKEENEINEFEILPDNHELPLGEIIKASLMVDAPDKPLCDKNCRGLCPQCGINLNNEDCNCENNKNDTNPFSVLKDLKIE